MARIGLISDTHGLLRPEALAFLRGSNFIIHAGDVGNATVIEQLENLAPLIVVRGNNDRGSWADSIAEAQALQVNDVRIYVLHDIAELDVDPASAGYGVVVFGHSHRPSSETRDGVLYVNPGSAGPRRFKLPISVGELQIVDGSVTVKQVEIAASSA